jgi:hypothetical protein
MKAALALAIIIASTTVLASATNAQAAPTRLEAENAVISQGVVESNHTGFSGAGFVNLDNVTGSYVEFTVTGPIAQVAVRYANGTTTNRPMSVNGITVNFPPTANWDTWATATVPLALGAGPHAVRLTSTTANGGPNLDYLEFTVVASDGYQAEDAVISQGVVEANHLNYTGTGFVNLDNVAGSYVDFTVTGPASQVNVRYANGTTADRPMSVNGVTVNFPPTADWDTWAVANVPLTLGAGAQHVRLTSSTANGGPNLDRIDLVTGSGGNVKTVSSISALQSALNSAVPGDRIQLTDGVYTTTGSINVTRSGTAASRIVVAAQHVGGAEIRGSAGFSLGAVSYVDISGFRLTHSGGFTIPGNAGHIRFSRNLVQIAGSTTNWVTVVGSDAEVDHNTFQNKSTQGVFLQITGPGDHDMAQRAWIHHNYFFHHTFNGSNGGESIRLGLSSRQLASAFATVEYNLFEQANGDSEAISVKSSDNIIRYNTLRDSRGWIVLRHGNRNRVEGNIGLGSGIRYYENDHVIVNNLVQGSQVIAGSGDVVDDTNNGTEHARPDRVLFAFNTVTGSGTLLDIGGGNTFGPDNCTFANNIFVGGGSGGLVNVSKGTNLHWQGNIIWAGSAGDMPSGTYRSVNPGLVTDAGGLRRLGSATSPAVDTAAGSYPQVTLDMDLSTRDALKDVGADEFGATQRRPLTTGDVGPSSP